MDNTERQRQGGVIIDKEALASAFMPKVYAWMVLGLVLTGFTAYFVASTPAIYMKLYANSLVPIILFIGLFALVMVISAGINKLSVTAAAVLFTVYSVGMGVIMSFIFLVYTHSSIATVFFICAGMFLALSLYGMTTKRNLSAIGSFMFMGLIGIIIASIANMFMRSEALYWVISYIGVFVFAGLTAYDTQRLKEMAYELSGAEAGLVTKLSIVGALKLYLDFINLFLFLLRIFGRQR